MTTTTLGSRRNASFIRAFVYDNCWINQYSMIGQWYKAQPVKARLRRHLCHEDFSEVCPEGWEFLGYGWSRFAFLGPDGVVYKVAKPNAQGSVSGFTSIHCNRAEARLYRDSAGKFSDSGVRLAASRLLWDSVIAMEFVPRSEGSQLSYGEIEQIEQATGLGDLHDGNIWKDSNGIPTIIDYAA